MDLKEFINEDKIYTIVENEIREWIENKYKGLSIEFYPHLEIVRTNEKIDYMPEAVAKIVEVVNIKIADILDAHAEEIYIAERLTRIWRNHPRFNIQNVKSLEDIKRNKKFLKYLNELIFRRKKKSNVMNIADYRRKEIVNE